MDSQSVLHAGIDDDRPSLFGTITNNHSPVQQANVVDAIHPSLSSGSSIPMVRAGVE